MRYPLFTCLIASLFAFAYGQEKQDYKAYDPWYTGPLITPSANCLEPGKSNFQPYIYYFDYHPSGFNRHVKQTQPDTLSIMTDNYVQFGLLDFLDVTFNFHQFYSHKDNINTFGLGDTSVSFGIQLLTHQENTPIPSIRLVIGETFPTGKYKNLDPNKDFLDATGGGTFKTGLSLNLSKKVFWIKYHPMNFRFTNSIAFPSLVRVKDFNFFGGGFNTYGKVSPSITYTTRFALEFSFNQRWAYAMDFEYDYSTKSTFSGHSGTNPDGSPAFCGAPSSQMVSIAPGLEYSFSEDLGIISGFWFPIYTFNVNEFFSYTISFTYAF